MKRDVRITILKSEVDQKLAEQYAVSGFERQHIWELEGNRKEMQCANGCHKQIYSNREEVLTMRKHREIINKTVTD